MSLLIDKRQSEIMKVMRFFAIIGVLMAHVSFNSQSAFLNFAYNRFACFGVPVFLTLSGFFFRIKVGEGFNDFVKKKFVNVWMPCIICASIVFFWLLFQRNDNFSLLVYFKFIIGYGSIYYYITVLLVLMTFFFFLQKQFILWSAISINIISILLTAFGVFSRLGLESFNYLNIFNWCGFFAAGILIQEKPPEKYSVKLKRWLLIISIILFIVSFALDYFIGSDSGYFSSFSLVTEISTIIIVYSISRIVCLSNDTIFAFSKYSYTIYLLHQPLLGFLYKRLGNQPLTQAVIPILTVIIAME